MWLTSESFGVIIISFLGEFFGTAILMFVGCLTTHEAVYGANFVSVILPAFGFGLAILISIMCFAEVSGSHINPAVTTGLVLLGHTDWSKLFIYVPAQYLGSIVGYGTVWSLANAKKYGAGERHPYGFCTLTVNKPLSWVEVFIIEVIGTWILVWVVFSVVDPRNAHRKGAISIHAAMAVSGIVFAIGPFSGAGINPARALSPNIWNMYFTDFWVFQLAPIIGAVIGAMLYRFIFYSQEPKSLATKGGIDPAEEA